MLKCYDMTIEQINFNKQTENEFVKILWAKIPGIAPEDVEFKELSEIDTPYNDIFNIKISCDTSISETMSYHYSTILKLDKREFYGFDYAVFNGLLKVILYKTYGKEVNQIGFGSKFISKYPRKFTGGYA